MVNDGFVQWYDEAQTVIYATLPQEWTWGDAYEMIDRVYQLQDAVTAPTDIIYDFRGVHPLPKAAFPNLRRLVNSEHPNDRLNVIVTRDSFLRRMLELVVCTFQQDREKGAMLRFVSSLEEAEAAIAHLSMAEISG